MGSSIVSVILSATHNGDYVTLSEHIFQALHSTSIDTLLRI